MYNRFDRFCHKHKHKGIKNLMTVIAVGSLAVYIMDLVMINERIDASWLLFFHKRLVLQGEYWRLITFIFVPPTSFLGPILTPLVLYFYHWLGKLLEAEWGRLKLNFYYLTGILSVLAYGFITETAFITAVQLNMSLFLAVATLLPDMQIRIYLIIPVKMKWLALIYTALLLYSIAGTRSFLPLIPLCNYLLYFMPVLMKMIRRPRHKKNLQFRAEARRVGSLAKQRGYLHQCAVCGLTDAQAPGTEFRYCSKCPESRCYCPEHLKDHEHL